MSTDETPNEVVEAVQENVVERRPKNVHRLNRIFRKPKTTVAKRSWHPAGAPPRQFGIPRTVVEQLVQSLSQEEKERAEAGQPPLSTIQLELAKRAARFGVTIQTGPSVTQKIVVDEAVLKQRQARFGSVSSAPIVALSEEDKAAMEARMRRFGAAPPS